MKNLILFALFAFTGTTRLFSQTGGTPPHGGCPPLACTTQFSFINLSTDCDYELCLYVDSVTAAYFAECPINFPSGSLPDTIACVSLPKNQSTPANIDVPSFFCPPGKYLYLRAELKRIPGGNSNNYSIHQSFQDLEKNPRDGLEEGSPLCGGNKTAMLSDDGLFF